MKKLLILNILDLKDMEIRFYIGIYCFPIFPNGIISRYNLCTFLFQLGCLADPESLKNL